MSGTWRRDRLPEIVRSLASRPKHEAVRVLIGELLTHGFGIPSDAIEHEKPTRIGRGRIDAMFGTTVIELKTDLRREMPDVEARLPEYLRAAAQSTRRDVVGLATDGAEFIAFELQGAALRELAKYTTNPDCPEDLLAWLEPLLSEQADLEPAPRAIAQAFGRWSVTFGHARAVLAALWERLKSDPEIALKRDLWSGLLAQAYGEEQVAEDALFLQHSYLTLVVKAIAARVLDLPVDDAHALLDGRALTEAGIQGAVEADFFDWMLREPEGVDLVRHVALETARFRLRDVEADVLKALYESLIDPEQRHDLGEYYTPDWLAARVVKAAITEPLAMRVLDPACGSGTFLFHALRHLARAAEAAGWSAERTLSACSDQVRGLDVHPVAITIARVTWLLALGRLVSERIAPLRVPVFLGDGLQWNLREYVGGRDVLVEVPNAPPLQIPAGFAEDQERFEAGLEALNDGLRFDSTPDQVGRALRRIETVAEPDADALAGTFAQLQALYKEGRDGIWTFVFRNLVRPVWLSRPDQRADVLIGNPPWIAYRHLSAKMKEALRSALQGYDLWVGGNLATQQDIFALFWARGAERYVKPGGKLCFVLPYAVLNAPVFAGLRGGTMGPVRVRITGAWALEKVWPIFGAQSGVSTTSTCVLFGKSAPPDGVPRSVDRWIGRLPRRDAIEVEADRALIYSQIAWPPERFLIGASEYRSRFRDGATIYPRRLFLVEQDHIGRLGSSRHAPRLRGRTGNLDKRPWNEIDPPRGPVESNFIRSIILGETILPYRLLETTLAVLPIHEKSLLDSRKASELGFRHLASWLRDTEAKWDSNSRPSVDGEPRTTLSQQLDHLRKLTFQLQSNGQRVVYTKSGTKLSSAILSETDVLVDHKAYWCYSRSLDEARYLTSVINSDAVLNKIRDLQPHGQRDPRDFDKLVWTLPIPEYTDADPLHRDLAAAAAEAEQVASGVDLATFSHFTAKRRAIRAALEAHGIADEIETLVAALLPN